MLFEQHVLVDLTSWLPVAEFWLDQPALTSTIERKTLSFELTSVSFQTRSRWMPRKIFGLSLICWRANSTAGMTPRPMAPSGILELTGKKPAAWRVNRFPRTSGVSKSKQMLVFQTNKIFRKQHNMLNSGQYFWRRFLRSDANVLSSCRGKPSRILGESWWEEAIPLFW